LGDALSDLIQRAPPIVYRHVDQPWMLAPAVRQRVPEANSLGRGNRFGQKARPEAGNVLAHHLPVDAVVVHEIGDEPTAVAYEANEHGEPRFGNETLLEGGPFVNVYSFSHLA